MDRRKPGIVSVFAGLLVFFCLGTEVFSGVLPVKAYEREHSLWSWAAATQCMLNYFGHDLTQYDIAKFASAGDNVNNSIAGITPHPVTGANVYGCDFIFSHWRVTYEAVLNVPLTETEIRTEIDAGSPILVNLRWYSGGDHYLVICGYDATRIYSLDPATGSLSYGDYPDIVDNGISYWYYTIKTNAGPTKKATFSQQTAINLDNTETEFTIVSADGGQVLAGMTNGSWAEYGFTDYFDFGTTGAQTFTARVACALAGGEIRISTVPEAPVWCATPERLLGVIKVPATGGDLTFQTVSCELNNVRGLHSIYLRFVHSNATQPINLHWFQFGAANLNQIEAESMTLSNYTVTANSSASNGSLVRCSSGEGIASYTYKGSSGVHQIKTWYYDENDGSAVYTLSVGGVVKDEWIANQSLGSPDQVAATRTSRTISGVTINLGDVISIKGKVNGSENAAVDLLEIVKYESPTVGLARNYRFNNSGSDSMPSGKNMAFVGSPSYTTDRFNTALSAILFDGTDDYAWADATLLPVGERTISLWFKANNTTSRPVLCSYGGAFTDHRFSMGLNNSADPGKYRIGSENHSAFPLTYAYPADPVNIWYHWVVTTDYTGTKSYVNGQLVASNTTYMDNSRPDGKQLSVGVSVDDNGQAPFSSTSVGYLSGAIDDLRIYNTALSQGEINLLYNAPPSVATAAVSSANPVNGTTANFSVLGSDAYGEGNLTYTWSAIGTPPAAVTFSVNGTNAAKNTVATFTASGTYSFQVSIKDQSGAMVNSFINNLSVTVPGAGNVTALTGWVSGTTNTKVAGSNRLMTVMVMGESTADFSATGVTYGGQAMTKQSEKLFYVTSGRTYASIFTLTESGVNAASSGTIAVTWSATPSAGSSVYSVLLSNVDQTTPVGVTANNGLDGTTITTTALSALAGDMIIMCGGTGSNTTSTFNNGFTKQFESNSGWGDGVGGNKAGTGVSETPSFTQSATGRMALCAVVVRKSGTTPTNFTLTTTATNGSVSPSGGTYASGTILTLTASANTGYTFTSWSGALTGTSSSAALTMNANKSVTANFSVTSTNYTLTTTATNGSVSPSGGTYASGTIITLTATPNSGYTFSSWSGGLTGTSNPAPLTMNANKSVTANFSVGTTLNVTALSGWVSGTTNTKVAGSNRLMVVMVMGESNAEFYANSVTYGGQPMVKQVERLYWVSGNRTYASIFAINESGVNAATSGAIAVTWSATPSAGNSVYSVLLANVDQSTPIASTAQNALTGTTVSTGALGVAAGEMVIICGATENNITQTFNNGFTKQFESNTAWGDGVGGNKMGTGVSETPSFTQSASGRMSLCAVVVKKSGTTTTNYTLTTISTNGSVSPSSGTYASGTIITLTATPNSGYTFSSWTGGLTGTSNPAPLTMNANKSVTANFSVSTTNYTLTTTSTNGSVSPSSGTYASGTIITLTATPNSGYTFTSWSGGLTGTTNPASLTMNANKSVTANFSVSTTNYTLTTTSTNGSVSPSSGTYASGTIITLTATPNSGYTFTSWSGGLTGTTNPAPLTMNANKSVTANFVVGTTLNVTALTGWVSGTTNNKVAGSNRLMTVMVMGESAADFSATGVTYGGQAMTKQSERMFYETGNRNYAAIFTLNESGVNAASSGAIAVTWSATPSVGSSVYSVLLSNVNQTTPVSATAQNALTGTSITTTALSALAGDMVIMCGATGSNITQTFNNGFTKQFESNSGWGDGVGGNKAGSGASETPSFTQSASGRMVLCAISIKKN